MATSPLNGLKPWTSQAKAELAELWMMRPPLKMKAIADAIGRSVPAVQTAASRFGLAYRGRKAVAIPTNGVFRKCLTCPTHIWSSDRRRVWMCPHCRETLS